jgi:predicted dehydrogenase
MSKIKCGVIGTGYLGQHHARIYREFDDCELVGICDSNPERAKEIAEKYGCKIFPSVEDLGRACDAVSVAVPTDQHFAVAQQVIAQNCHLMIEKPLCQSLQEAEGLLALAKQHDRILQVGHIEHYNPVMSFLETVVDNPKFIVADRLAPFNPRGTEVGVVLDLMIHDIGIILHLVRSPVKSIDSIGVNILSSTEDIANARITFENGCIANINTSRVSLKKLREIRVFQPNLYMSLDFVNQKGHLMKKVGQTIVREDVPIQTGEPLKIELRSFIDCVQNASAPKVNIHLGKQALEIAICITEAIRRVNFGG